MLPRAALGLSPMVDSLKAIGESSRLRIALLLARGDLTVSDLTEVLGQSQPRVSRHLRLLLDAGLIARYQEGSWAYFCLADSELARELVAGVLARIDPADPDVDRDLQRLENVKRKRQKRARDYFSANAASWDRIRSLHAPDRAVEAALKEVVGERRFQSMLDLGTGTGRILEIFAPLYVRGIGIDMSREMLNIARANLDRAGTANAQVRQGDIYAPPAPRDSFDLATIHQVLHYLEEPGVAIREAARLLRPGGRLIVVDFAPHPLEFLRDQHAHVRLGFSDRQMAEWIGEAGLDLKETRTFAPEGEGPLLTVKLWAAQDRRLLMAGQTDARHPEGETV